MKDGKMMVWMVAGSLDYEGDSVRLSGAVFVNYEDAVKYGESLLDGSNEEGYHFDDYVLKEVNLG